MPEMDFLHEDHLQPARRCLDGLSARHNAGAAYADSKACPPGLAKKGVTTGQWLNGDRTGDVIDRADLIYLDVFLRYDLPPLPYGQRYAIVDDRIVDDRIVVIEAESYKILQLIQIFTSLDN